MKLKNLFLFFAMILLLCANSASAQDDDGKEPEDMTAVPNAKLVWRTIDISAKNTNAVLACMIDAQANKTDFNHILSNAVQSHKVAAYTIEGNLKNIDTLSAMWHYSYKGAPGQTKGFDKLDNTDDPSLYSANKYFIEEYWIFVKELNRMVCTIEWVGPCGTEDGSLKPLFAVKFEDISPLLGKYSFCNNKDENKYACLDFFESRAFTSDIVMTSHIYINTPKEVTEAKEVKEEKEPKEGKEADDDKDDDKSDK